MDRREAGILLWAGFAVVALLAAETAVETGLIQLAWGGEPAYGVREVLLARIFLPALAAVVALAARTALGRWVLPPGEAEEAAAPGRTALDLAAAGAAALGVTFLINGVWHLLGVVQGVGGTPASPVGRPLLSLRLLPIVEIAAGGFAFVRRRALAAWLLGATEPVPTEPNRWARQLLRGYGLAAAVRMVASVVYMVVGLVSTLAGSPFPFVVAVGLLPGVVLGAISVFATRDRGRPRPPEVERLDVRSIAAIGIAAGGLALVATSFHLALASLPEIDAVRRPVSWLATLAALAAGLALLGGSERVAARLEGEGDEHPGATVHAWLRAAAVGAGIFALGRAFATAVGVVLPTLGVGAEPALPARFAYAAVQALAGVALLGGRKRFARWLAPRATEGAPARRSGPALLPPLALLWTALLLALGAGDIARIAIKHGAEARTSADLATLVQVALVVAIAGAWARRPERGAAAD